MSYTNFNFGINIGGGGHHGHHGHHGIHRMHHGGGWHHGGGIPTSLLGYPGSMPYYSGYNNWSSSMIGVPNYGYYQHGSYNHGINTGGAITGATTGAAFGSILGLGLSGGDPAIGLLTTLLGAGLGYSAGGNLGRYGCF